MVKKGGTKDGKICQKREMLRRKRERDGTERDIPRKERERDDGEDVKARGERQKDEKGCDKEKEKESD